MGADGRQNCLYIVLNWCSAGPVTALVRGLLAAGVPADRCLVLDNASPDGSGAAIAAALAPVEVLDTGANRGFSGGMNVGLRRAADRGFGRAVLLNDDLEVDAAALAAMHDAMDARPDAGVVGAVLVEPGGGLAHAAETISPVLGRIGRGPRPARDAPPRPCDWVSGALLLLRVAAFEAAGGFDEEMFMYWEEVDLCLRWRAAGWRTYLAPGAEATHEDAGGRAGAHLPRYLQWRNRWRLGRNHWPWYGRGPFHLWTLLNLARDLIGRTRAGDRRGRRAAWLGNLHGASGYGGDRGLAEVRRALAADALG